MDCSTTGLPVLHHLQEFTQTHVHWVGDAIQPSRPLSSPSPAFNLFQHQALFKWVKTLKSFHFPGNHNWAWEKPAALWPFPAIATVKVTLVSPCSFAQWCPTFVTIQIIHGTYSSLWGFSVVGRQAGPGSGAGKSSPGSRRKPFRGSAQVHSVNRIQFREINTQVTSHMIPLPGSQEWTTCAEVMNRSNHKWLCIPKPKNCLGIREGDLQGSG